MSRVDRKKPLSESWVLDVRDDARYEGGKAVSLTRVVGGRPVEMYRAWSKSDAVKAVESVLNGRLPFKKGKLDPVESYDYSTLTICTFPSLSRYTAWLNSHWIKLSPRFLKR